METKDEDNNRTFSRLLFIDLPIEKVFKFTLITDVKPQLNLVLLDELVAPRTVVQIFNC